ncbi:hypothetical protein NX722_13475 [Endozoicomonas gorgoniicola]|uniref:Uncharacterized protein n=1 Tax=Endozoicomonas gorgoniicola TaxID=1234144 RepID=A0ABT3MX32_9GAMM|nr:hypothetical protein [Endozoicomonas gorgoniicola]MCW7553618.1 hypothetical protein [Endozoicomonas gorgoniicola]
MNTKELAQQLNGTEYPLRPSAELKEQAKVAGLVIVYGASDDLMDFDGAIYDELGCYEGGIAFVDEKGLLPERKNIEDDEELKEFFSRQPKAKSIEAVFDEDDYTWLYKTDIPHETFEIVSDGEKYCKGMVFSLADIYR